VVALPEEGALACSAAPPLRSVRNEPHARQCKTTVPPTALRHACSGRSEKLLVAACND
jgi:hypothetical protein